MTRLPLLLLAGLALLIAAYGQDALGASDCADPICHAWQQTSRSSPIEGIEYRLDSPDLWVDRSACDNTAVAAGWLVADTGEWAEAGVTKGDFKNVGCVGVLSTYYAINNVVDGDNLYQEYLVPNGRVDPGNDITVRIQKHLTQQVQVHVTTPYVSGPTPQARVGMDPDNVYRGNFGIEGTVSATDDYSSISASKFTGMRVRQGGTWIDMPDSATLSLPSVSEGYRGQECRGSSFIAGTVTSLDCDHVATRNQLPTVQNQRVNATAGGPITIDIAAVDTDGDYLSFYLVGAPAHGSLDHVNMTERIPNVNGTAVRLVYTPDSQQPEPDLIRYTVTDGRYGHTREGTVSITGSSAETVPDAVDDFAHTLSGNTVTFTWSAPDDGGSEITSFVIQRSHDTVTWGLHDTVSETTTSLEHAGYPGYDQYFRIFARNAHGLSPASDVVHVRVADPTPPVITVTSPADGATVTVPGVGVSGYADEPDSEIDYVEVYVNGTLSADPVSVTRLGTRASFESTLTGLDNGRYAISVRSANVDGAAATRSVSMTLDVPDASTLSSFAEDFEGGDLSRWFLYAEDDEYWSVRADPAVPVPGSQSGNRVGGAEDCDDVCTMEMVDEVDLTEMSEPTLSFYRLVARGADVSNSEGIYVDVSEDGGGTWRDLASFTANGGQDDGAWHLETYTLTNSSDSFKVRFEARSSSNSEDTELDDIRIYDAADDTVAPEVTAPADVTAEATGVLTAVSIGRATATDDRDSDPEITSDAPDSFPLGDTTVTWTATDDAGNSATATQTITVRDTTPPVITAPAAYAAEAAGAMTELDEGDYGTATATDLADPSTQITSNAPSSFPVGTTTITWTATDGSGNSATATQAVTVRSTAAPMITAPADYAAEAAGALTQLDEDDYGTATATDLVDPDPEITSNAPDSFPLGDTVVTWTATNDAGNSATAAQTITVRDTTPPVITAPTAYAAEATGAMTELDEDDYGTATATDLVDPDPEITSNAPDSFPLGATTITWTATDASGNTATAMQTVTVRQTVQPDTTAPAVTAPGSVTAEATGTLTVVSIGQATATDDRDPSPEITSDAPDSFPLGDTVVTWTATDDAGNSATATQTVTVRDTTPPVITAPAAYAAEAAGAMTELDEDDYGTATATDLADPDPAVAHNAPSSFPLGDTAITWTATDGSGNSATAAQTVTVRDTTPPMIASPPDIEVIVPQGGNATVYFAVPEATDLADPDVAVSCAPASGSVFRAGSTAVACTATDGSGNESSATFDVLVTAAAGQDVLSFDFEDGGLSGRLVGWAESGGERWRAEGPDERRNPPGSPAHNRVAQADGCSTECVMTLSLPVDMTLYRSEELTFYRYIDDDLDPTEYLRLDAFDGSSWEELGRWTPEDSDDDDRWHLERYPLGAYTDTEAFKIRFSAKMSSPDEEVAIDDVMLTAARAADAEPPVITAPPDAAFEAAAPLTPLDAGDYGAATATDGSGAPPAVTSDAPASFPVGDTVITWTATDASGNTATAAQTVTVRDTAPPAFASVPHGLTFVAPAGGSATAGFAPPAAADIADPDVAVSCDPEPGAPLAVGITAVTCTATDASGNESRASFEVRVVAGVRQDARLYDFEVGPFSGELPGWTKSGVPRWHSGAQDDGINPPGHPSHNVVAEANGCTAECVMTMSSPVDLTPYGSEVLTFHRFLDDLLDRGEYLRVDAFDGSSWVQLDRWAPEDSDDGAWHLERYELDAYTDTEDFKVRFATKMSDHFETVAVDDVRITALVPLPDTAPPVITAPPDVTAAARGILSAVDLGTASATDAVDPAVAVTSNATEGGSTAMLGFGATTILWTATDSSGNTANATQTVTVDPSGLDTAWQYRLVESYHLPYAPHAAVTASMDRWSFSDIGLGSTGINNGTMYLFKSFPAAEVRGGNVTVSMVADTGPYVGVSLLDGAYSADAGSDFGPGGPAPKGGGTLASYEMPAPAEAPASPSALSVTLAPDWDASRLDRVTLLVETSRPPDRQSLLLRSVDVGDGSRWVFGGYGVAQGTGNGTLDLFPADPGSGIVHALPLNDTFDSSLDGWTYRGSTSEYVLEWRPEGGRGAAHLHIDGFGIEGGMQKAVDVSGLDASRQRLVLSYDYRASSDSEASIITHSRLAVLDADSHALLHHANVMPGGTTDTGWRTYTTDITGHAAGHDAVRVFLHLRDGWIGSNDQRNWYDNVRLYVLDQTDPVPTTNTRAQ